MNKRTERNYKMQLDYAYAQLEYWKMLAKANKIELEYFRGLVMECRCNKLEEKKEEE